MAADALSWNYMDVFFEQVPGAEREPTLLSFELIHILMVSKPD